MENPLDGIEQIEQIEDPAARAREAGQRLAAIPAFQERLRVIRQAAVLELRGQGKSFEEIAELIGLTRNRVHQIAKNLPGGAKAARARHAAGDDE